MNSRHLFLSLGLLLHPACKGDKGGDTGPGPADGGSADGGSGDGGGANSVDVDGDGYDSEADCDDNNYTAYPGAPERCDGVDQDCDDFVDEDFDLDLDGSLDAEECPELGNDCDDADNTVYGGAVEVPYDGVDQDCDGADLADVDGDGFVGAGAGGNDCDDEDPTVNPAADDPDGDGIDQDCDGAGMQDLDGDGFDDTAVGGADCDDGNPSVYPGAPGDWMNDAHDSDCDGVEPEPLSLDDASITFDGTSGAQSIVGETVLLCDLDEDGLDDLVVTAPMHNSYTGVTGVWYGLGAAGWTTGMTMESADLSMTSDTTYEFFGFNAVCADFDGDGHLDLLIQQGEVNSYYFEAEWNLHLLYGDGSTRTGSLTLDDADATFSYTMGVPYGISIARAAPAKAADLDGDGKAELVLTYGHPDFSVFDGEERVLILPGGTYEGTMELDEVLSHTIAPSQSDDFGGDTPWYLSSVLVGDDFDGDGNADLMVLSQEWDGEEGDTADTGADATDVGAVDWLGAVPAAGGELLLSDLSEARIYGSTGGLRLGHRAIAGDFNGDGDRDVIVSSAGSDPDGNDNTGGLFLLQGIAADLAAAGGDLADLADAWVYGDIRGHLLGYALAAAGDVDGDGADDFLVSAPSPTFTEDDEGRTLASSGAGGVWLVSGALFTGELASIDDAALMIWTDSLDEHYTGSSLHVGDVDGDGLADFVFGSKNYGYTRKATDDTPGRAVVYLGRGL